MAYELQGLRTIGSYAGAEILRDASGTGLIVHYYNSGTGADRYVTLRPGFCRLDYLLARDDLKRVPGIEMQVPLGVSGVSTWISDGTTWRPSGRFNLFRNVGSLATPLSTLTGVTSGTFANLGTVPAGLLAIPGLRMQTLALFKRSGTNGTARVNLLHGSTNLVDFNFTTTNNLEVRIQHDLWVGPSGTCLSTGVIAPGATLQNATADRSVVTTSDQVLSLTLSSANALDTFLLTAFEVSIG